MESRRSKSGTRTGGESHTGSPVRQAGSDAPSRAVRPMPPPEPLRLAVTARASAAPRRAEAPDREGRQAASRAHALRIAAIDIGTNSIHMVIAEATSPA